MPYPTDFIEEDRSIPKRYRMTLLAIHHPNHFDGKWTLLATCAKKDEREMFQDIAFSYPNYGILPPEDYSSLVSFSHKGICIEDLHDFLSPGEQCQQLLEQGQIRKKVLAEVLSRQIKPFDPKLITLDFGKNAYRKLALVEKPGEGWPDSTECGCLDHE